MKRKGKPSEKPSPQLGSKPRAEKGLAPESAIHDPKIEEAGGVEFDFRPCLTGSELAPRLHKLLLEERTAMPFKKEGILLLARKNFRLHEGAESEAFEILRGAKNLEPIKRALPTREGQPPRDEILGYIPIKPPQGAWAPGAKPAEPRGAVPAEQPGTPPADQQAPANEGEPVNVKRSRGRPRKTSDSPEHEKIMKAWKTGAHKTYADCADALRDPSIDASAVKYAVDRDRK